MKWEKYYADICRYNASGRGKSRYRGPGVEVSLMYPCDRRHHLFPYVQDSWFVLVKSEWCGGDSWIDNQGSDHNFTGHGQSLGFIPSSEKPLENFEQRSNIVWFII